MQQLQPAVPDATPAPSGGLYLLLGCALGAILADTYTTAVALTGTPARYGERTTTVAALIHGHGLTVALTLSAVGRCLVFVLLVLVIRRVRRPTWPLFGIGYVAAGITWLIAADNVWTLAGR